MSWLASVSGSSEPPQAGGAAPKNFHAVTERYKVPGAGAVSSSGLYGPLTPLDTQWNITKSGFATETMTFYSILDGGKGMFMAQVIHSSVGLWYPNITFNFRYYSPSKSAWKSVSVTNFQTPPANSPKLDKRSSKSDQFTITLDPTRAEPDTYLIQGNYDTDVQISWTVRRLTHGWKLGLGPRGGISYFGKLGASDQSSNQTGAPDFSSGGDGFVMHQFWPRCSVEGISRVGNDVIDMKDSRGIFIHAIQGMRPNLIASKWNFVTFQSTPSSSSSEEAVSLTQMEFETISSYGRVKVNVGSVTVGDKLVSVCGGEGSSECFHVGGKKDPETGYKAPAKIEYRWTGDALVPAETAATDDDGILKVADDLGKVQAKLDLDLMIEGTGDTYESKGLIIKVDVLGEIPYLIKKFVNYAAGTKPYIYTWFNPATASITLPSALISPGAPKDETKTLTVKGHVFNEATFIS